MKKRFVLSGYFGFKNFGDEAILSVLINKLQKDGHKITVISSDPKYTTEQYKYIRSIQTFKILDIIFAILKSDVLVSGGGSLLQDVTSIKSLIYYLTIIFIALILQKKVIIFAQGIGPINNKFGQILTKILLKHCTYVSVRDKKSFELLESWGIESDLLCDPIFSTVIPSTEKTNTVAVQLRNFNTMNRDFIDRLAQKTVQEFSEKKIEIFSFQDSIDYDICQEFQKAVNLLNPHIETKLYSNLSNEDIINKLSKAEFLIAMRFHAIIIGLLAECKILSINYDIKVEKISNEFNIPMLDLKKEFSTQFNELKKQIPQNKKEQLKKNSFNWTNFDLAINK
ncbi:polysaccharide pyruvyl transferase CsaB [bacterium]|nr:polysaccharide pyruvyl transferase CsaB [bacterium]